MPDFVTGKSLPSPDGYPNEEQGRFFSSFPAATPKYARNAGPRRSEFVETMARFIVDVPQGYATLRNSLPGDVKAVSRTLLYNGKLDRGTHYDSGIGYFDFLLTQIQQPHQEREQAVDTLTDNTVIFYGGQTAPVLSGSGTLFNTYQDDQNVWFQLIYSELLRGTMLARRGLLARLRYDSFFMTGYMSSLVTATTGDVKNAVQFSFTFRVKQIQIITPILYHPSNASSVISTNILTREQPSTADDTVRSGVETAETPATPSSVPAASQQTGTDTREAAHTDGVPSQVAREATDAQLATQQAALAAAQPTDPTAASAIDQASSHPVEGAGDARDNLNGVDALRVQDFRRSPEEMARFTAGISNALVGLSETTPRGTTTISPVTQSAEPSGAYADSIARASTAATTDPQAPADVTEIATTENHSLLDDVYRPPPKFVQEYNNALQTRTADGATTTPVRRTRQRSTV